MDQYNWLVTEIMVEQKIRQIESHRQALPESPHTSGALRHTLAGAMVRFGLRLDPTAGERIALTLAPEGRH